MMKSFLIRFIPRFVVLTLAVVWATAVATLTMIWVSRQAGAEFVFLPVTITGIQIPRESHLVFDPK